MLTSFDSFHDFHLSTGDGPNEAKPLKFEHH